MNGPCTTAVVLAAGRGTRMRRVAGTAALDQAQAAIAADGIKGMIPDTRGRPFLDHVLSSIADAGIADVCLVIGPDHDMIRAHYMSHAPTRIRVGFTVQEQPTGTADGLLAAEKWCAGRDFIALNADNLYPVGPMQALVALGGPGLIAFDRDALVRDSNIEQERIGSFAIISLHEDGTLATITEKPGPEYGHAMPCPFISMNIWRFDSAIFAACRTVPVSPRGEHELPMAVSLAISQGMRLHAVHASAGVLDLSNRGDIATVSEKLGRQEIAL